MNKKNPELSLLQELVELDELKCPMILVIVPEADGTLTSNCPRGQACLCKGRGEVIRVRVPEE